MNKEQKKKIAIIVGIVAVVVLFIIAAVSARSDDRKRDSLLKLGDKYLSEMDYEAAIATYDQVLAIDPKCEEAYIGKATAQFNLGLYEEAMETLQKGIGKIGESLALMELLEMIKQEYEQLLMEPEPENMDTQTEHVEIQENNSQFLMLNYTSITKHANSEDMQVQLEVIADKEAVRGKTVWTSQDPDIAVVSEDGLVSFTGEEGWSRITADNGSHKAYCDVNVVGGEYDSSREREEVNIPIPGRDGNREEDYFSIEHISEAEEEDEKEPEATILDTFVYYSGDVEIPSKLQYQGKEIQVTQIEGEAFAWSIDLLSVTIPASVREFVTESNPFYFCRNLEEIVVDEGNENFKVVDGVLYSADGSDLLAYPAKKTDRSFTIPKKVERVYEGAFCGNKYLEEILVEDGNERYESMDGALVDRKDEYYGCKTLAAYPCGSKAMEYVVTDDVERIGNYAFAYSSVEKVVCGSGLTDIGFRGFWNCERLKSIEGLGQVRDISSDYFDGCFQLENIEVGKETESIWLSGYDIAETITLVGLEEMSNLKNLSLQEIKLQNVTDLEWIQNLINLNQLSIEMEGLSDLTPLLEMKNLTYVYIKGLSEDEMSEETRQILQEQLEELRAANPDCEYHISGLD